MDKDSLSVFYDVEYVGNKENSLSVFIIVMIISFIIGLYFSYLIIASQSKQRKTKLNELKDDYEYIEK